MIEILDGLDKNIKIQKYMDLNKFINLLETEQLFFCRINDFKDQLEGGLTILDNFFLSGAADALDNFVNNSLVRTFGSNHNSQEVIDAAITRERKYKESLTNRSTNTVFGCIPINDEMTHKKVIQCQKNWLHASCWHTQEKDHESMAMWKIYGGLSHAICITTTLDKLLNSLSLKNNYRLIASKVEYIDHSQDHYKVDHPVAPFIHKHRAYSYENEIRLIAYNHDINPLNDRNPDELGMTLLVDIQSMIENVKVSPETPDWFFNTIKTLVNDRYSINAIVTRSDLDKINAEI